MSKKINTIWRNVWLSQNNVSADDVFSSRLFVEGYQSIKGHIPLDAISMLEAGGGTGRYGIQMACDYPYKNVLVIDCLNESLELGRSLASRKGVKNIRFELNDILGLSFDDDSFDCVFSDAVIQVFVNYQDAVNEIARVCKPGGTVIISVCNKWNFHTLYKFILRLAKQPYMYGYEKSFSHTELLKGINNAGLKRIAKGGFFVSYGIRRHNKLIYRIAGKLCDLVVNFLDPISGGSISNLFGFEIFIVAKKPKR